MDSNQKINEARAKLDLIKKLRYKTKYSGGIAGCVIRRTPHCHCCPTREEQERFDREVAERSEYQRMCGLDGLIVLPCKGTDPCSLHFSNAGDPNDQGLKLTDDDVQRLLWRDDDMS